MLAIGYIWDNVFMCDSLHTTLDLYSLVDDVVIIIIILTCLGVWLDRIRRVSTNPVVMRSSPATEIHVMHCWSISPNQLNLLLWLLTYLSDK